jgi:hypothetical protein
VFHDLKNVKIAEKSLKIGQLPILDTFYEFLHILKKVGRRGGPGTKTDFV